MQTIVNPQQTRLFDPIDDVLTAKTRERLLDGWFGVFRHVILELMPVDSIAGHFDPQMGRPTKELYSMAGLVFIMEFKNWTKEEALDAYRFHLDIQYSLNLEPVAHDISLRTLERYLNYFEEDNLAKTIMSDITVELVDLLGIRIDQQRLDSTHIFSDMASFGRTRMMGVTIKRFLTQVKRRNREDYHALPDPLRQRYTSSVHQLFGNTEKDRESRRLLRQQVAEDMYYLVGHFAELPDYGGFNTYKIMERIFYEQCEVHEDNVSVRAKTGGNVTQNPSDPDATYDGHKGSGYQAQIAETCNPENEVQIITCAIPQTAAQSDANAVEEVLDDLQSNDLVPDSMLADTGYTGDDNVQLAEEKGVELVGPVPSGSSKAKADEYEPLNIDDFDVDDATEEVIRCPAGHKPQSSEHNRETDKTKTVMPESACSQCDFFEQCPVEEIGDQYKLKHGAKERRLASRRREQDTEVFRERYKTRGGIEGTNSGLKRKTGLGQLRVRGRPAVFHAIYLKIAGWNVLRASVCAKMREIVHARANKATFCLDFAFLGRMFLDQMPRRRPEKGFSVGPLQFAEFSRFHAVA
jgi:hypothetical protein